MTKRAKPEILAPAGSMEGLKAAIAAGCNAVYIGGNRFGARAFANNLDQDEMLEAIAYCHNISSPVKKGRVSHTAFLFSYFLYPTVLLLEMLLFNAFPMEVFSSVSFGSV